MLFSMLIVKKVDELSSKKLEIVIAYDFPLPERVKIVDLIN